jgi:hypothetical protein
MRIAILAALRIHGTQLLAGIDRHMHVNINCASVSQTCGAVAAVVCCQTISWGLAAMRGGGGGWGNATARP